MLTAEEKVELLRSAIRSETEGALRDMDEGDPWLMGWEIKDLRGRLEHVLRETE